MLQLHLLQLQAHLNMKSSCLLSWCGGMNVLAASCCPPPVLLSLRHLFIMLGMAMGADVPCTKQHRRGQHTLKA
jgi:hypothetical protein